MIESGVYRAMIENALDAFFLTDINGYVYDANSAACEMFGYTLEEIKGVERKQIIDLASPGLEDYLKVRQEKGKVTCELIGICLLYTSPSPRDRQKSRMPSSA